ncbi:Uncharacterised protein [Escherichia coli]|uniref:Uncharacterized protein n=1 Tax=Escherichia coli TaxID=562 RepID=A0A376K2M4_ECOLX|nr:Uncharacterised protein [Escherichia coli]
MTEDDVMLMTSIRRDRRRSPVWLEPVGDLVVDLSLDAARF